MSDPFKDTRDPLVRNKIAADARRDYEGMREFQAKFIAADHRLRALEAELADSRREIDRWIDQCNAGTIRIRALEAELAEAKAQIEARQELLSEDTQSYQVRISALEAELASSRMATETNFNLYRDEALSHQRLCLALANEHRALEAALRKAVSAHTGHFPWCAKGGQMPMEMGRQYTHPTDWDNWRATVECTCGIATLLTVRETGAEHG